MNDIGFSTLHWDTNLFLSRYTVLRLNSRGILGIAAVLFLCHGVSLTHLFYCNVRSFADHFEKRGVRHEEVETYILQALVQCLLGDRSGIHGVT